MITAKKAALIGTGIVGALVSFKYSRGIRSEIKELESSAQLNLNKPTLEIEGNQLVQYPWEQNILDFSLPDCWPFTLFTENEMAKRDI